MSDEECFCPGLRKAWACQSHDSCSWCLCWMWSPMWAWAGRGPSAPGLEHCVGLGHENGVLEQSDPGWPCGSG